MMSENGWEVKKEEKMLGPMARGTNGGVVANRAGTLASFLRKVGSGEIAAGQEVRGRYFEAWAYV